MDFHSLSRRELQALCKKNKIPANMTNVAMADALKALEAVEGLEEIMNQSLSNPPVSSPSTARTATRTARKTQTSLSVTRSCRVTRKALAGEMDLENKNVSVGEANAAAKLVADVPKTPAAQSSRRRGSVAFSRTKAPESIQRVYSTRRSVRLLEKTMADLSLKGKETVEPMKNDESDKEMSEEDKDPAGAEESKIIPERDLSATLEKEWDMREKVPEDDKSDAIEDVSVSNAKAETHEEKIDEFDTLTKDLAKAAADEKGSDDIPVSENSSEFGKEELENDEAPNSSEYMITNDNSAVPVHAAAEPADNAEKCEAGLEDNKIMLEEETLDEAADDDSMSKISTEEEYESESELSDADIDSEVESDEVTSAESDQRVINKDLEVDSDQSVAGSDVALRVADLRGDLNPEKPIVDQLEEQNEVQSSAESKEIDEDLSKTETERDMTLVNEQYKTKTLLNTNLVSEPEAQVPMEAPISEKTQTSPLVMASGGRFATPLSPFTAESIPGQFPRPNLSTPGKSSSKKPKSLQKLTLVAEDNNKKENAASSGTKTEQPKKDKMKKKKNEVDEEVLRGVSLRQLTKMVKELQIKSRPALQTLPGNQIAQDNRSE